MAVLGDRDPSVGLLDVGNQLGEPVAGVSQGKLLHSHKYRQIKAARGGEIATEDAFGQLPTLARAVSGRESADGGANRRSRTRAKHRHDVATNPSALQLARKFATLNERPPGPAQKETRCDLCRGAGLALPPRSRLFAIRGASVLR